MSPSPICATRRSSGSTSCSEVTSVARRPSRPPHVRLGEPVLDAAALEAFLQGFLAGELPLTLASQPEHLTAYAPPKALPRTLVGANFDHL